jgi:hypothetical protein
MQDKQKVTLYLPPELHRQLKIRAAVDGETMTDIAQRAIFFYMSHPEVIEQYEGVGQTHRIYSCPECTSPVALREGELISLSQSADIILDDSLPVEKVTLESVSAGSQGEELVPC